MRHFRAGSLFVILGRGCAVDGWRALAGAKASAANPAVSGCDASAQKILHSHMEMPVQRGR